MTQTVNQMAKRKKKTVPELIRDKLRFLEATENTFVTGIESTEKIVFAEALKLLRSFSQTENRLQKDSVSLTAFAKLRKDLLSIIRNTAFIPKVEKFLTDFNEVERLNKSIYSRTLNKPVKTNVNLEKQIIIDQVTDALLKPDSINANYTNLIRKNLTDSVRYGLSFDQAKENLERLVIGTGNGGQLKRYSRQIATDGLNQFDGAVNDVIRDAFLLDGFRYVGSIIKDSRSNCKDWVGGSGKFRKYAIRPGTFRVEDIPSMISIAKDRKGWNPNTTPETFAQYRGGYNCRHQIIYFRLTDEQNDQVEKQLSS